MKGKFKCAKYENNILRVEVQSDSRTLIARAVSFSSLSFSSKHPLFKGSGISSLLEIGSEMMIATKPVGAISAARRAIVDGHYFRAY